MKIRVLMLSCLAGIVLLSIGYRNGWAKPKKAQSEEAVAEIKVPKIAVVSVRTIFKMCKRNEQYKTTARAEQEKLLAELGKLQAEIEAGKADLPTRVAGSPDYMNLIKEILQKQGSYDAQKKFYQEKVSMQYQQWTEQLYSGILRVVTEVAQLKEFDLVLEMSEPEFPAQNANELTLAISTNKVLYNGGLCEDISAEVIARLDAEN